MKPQKRFKAKKLKSRRKRCNGFKDYALCIGIGKSAKSSQDCTGESLSGKID